MRRGERYTGRARWAASFLPARVRETRGESIMFKPKTSRVGILRTAAAGLVAADLAPRAAFARTTDAATTNLIIFGPSSLDGVPPAALPAIKAAFEKEYPNITITQNAEGAVQNDYQRFLTARLSNTPMDIVGAAANPTNGIYVRDHLLLPLDSIVKPFVDRFDASALAAYTIGGHLYAIPLSSMSTSTFYYNKTMFSHMSLEPPKTYADFKKLAAELRAGKVIPVLHQGKVPWFWPMWYFETFAQVAHGHSIDKTISNLQGKTKYTDAEDVTALDWVGRFATDGIVDKSSLGVDTDGMRSAFATQKSAIYYGGTWELPWIFPNVKKFEVGVFEFPQLFAGAKPLHGGGPDSGFGIYSGIDHSHLPAATRFLEFISRPKEAAVILAAMAPVATSVKGVPGLNDPISKQLRKEFFPHTIKFLDWIWPTEINLAFQNAEEGVFGGTQTAAQGMANVQAAYNKLVAKGYKY
jgi:raffinose/stachyose/melibiose transport system substrate-binding protein